MKKQSVTVNQLLDLIPLNLLSQLAVETKVDYQVKKLEGALMFKLLLFGLTNRKELSWRILEFIFDNYKFRQFAGVDTDLETDHSSLATRMSQMKTDYFRQIHSSLTKQLTMRYPVEKIGGYKIVRFDSTLVSIAGTLLKISGLKHGVNKSKSKPSDPINIKFSVGFDGLNGTSVKVFNQQTYISEDIALHEIILDHKHGENEMAVFDRGLASRKAFEEFSLQKRLFVTRLKAPNGKVKHKKVKSITHINPDQALQTETLLILEDNEVYLYGKSGAKTKHTYRLITTQNKDTAETLYFLTNEKELSVQDVLLIYARRWDIEVFFKFLKQEFGFKHFMSRNLNGIENMVYMTLICFILIFTYYKLNKISGFKIAKISFADEIEFEIMKTIIEMCNGDPKLLYTLKR